ncbi:DUF4134 domain-containing protein [Pedobacter sp. AW1-32]|uniref:DUF4134 domain-containing protein n=1 Tax=Pedobacter sp. AW1-32 TaxID=3383026 RepID=UPI003FEF82FA
MQWRSKPGGDFRTLSERIDRVCEKNPFLNPLSLSLILIFFPFHGSAQPGIGELNSASEEIKSIYYALSDLSLILGAILGILGGLRVFINWQNREYRVDIQVVGWFFSAIFLLLCGVFLRGTFSL